jgi:hypothetical protein
LDYGDTHMITRGYHTPSSNIALSTPLLAEANEANCNRRSELCWHLCQLALFPEHAAGVVEGDRQILLPCCVAGVLFSEAAANGQSRFEFRQRLRQFALFLEYAADVVEGGRQMLPCCVAGILISEAAAIEAHQQYTDSSGDRAKLFDFSTGLIGYFVEAITIRSREKTIGPLAEVDPEVRRIVEVLKQFIWEYVIQSPDLAVPQQGQRLAIGTVFDRLMNSAKDKHRYIFPPEYRFAISEAKTKPDRARVIADCISSMTEKELLHPYRCGE